MGLDRRLADRCDRRDRRGVPRCTPSPGSRSSCAPATPGQTKPRGREDEEIEKRRRTPEGWRVIGSRERVTRRRPRAGDVGRRPVRRSRSTSTSRSASRSARTATSWSSPAPRRAGRGPGSTLRAPPSRPSSSCARTPSTRPSAAGRGAAARDAVPRRRHAVAAAARRDRRELVERVRARFGLAADAEVTLEANPGPDERGDAAALGRAGVTRLSIGAQSLDDARAAPPRAPSPGAPTSPTPSPRPARPGSGRSAWTCLYDVPDQTVASWMATLDAALELGAGPPVALRADARRPRRGGPDRPRRRSPPDDAWAPVAGARSRGPARTRIARPPCTTTRSCAWPRPDSAGYEISNWARPGHESRHNLTYWERRPYEAVGPGRTRLRWRDPALERGSPGRLCRGAHTVRRVPAAAAARRLGADRPRRRGCRGRSSSASASTPASRLPRSQEPPLADDFGWALAAELLDVTTDDRVVLTTRGRLLSNELFARLV